MGFHGKLKHNTIAYHDDDQVRVRRVCYKLATVILVYAPSTYPHPTRRYFMQLYCAAVCHESQWESVYYN